MLLLIDDANIDAIRELCGYFPVDGVTTNPSILAANRREPYAVLEEIRQLIGPDKQLHVQVTSQTAEDMVAEGLCDLLPEYLFSKKSEKASSMSMRQHLPIPPPLS